MMSLHNQLINYIIALIVLKYSLKPVVTAVQGRALGGGCELVLYSPIVVAASESLYRSC